MRHKPHARYETQRQAPPPKSRHTQVTLPCHLSCKLPAMHCTTSSCQLRCQNLHAFNLFRAQASLSQALPSTPTQTPRPAARKEYTGPCVVQKGPITARKGRDTEKKERQTAPNPCCAVAMHLQQHGTAPNLPGTAQLRTAQQRVATTLHS